MSFPGKFIFKSVLGFALFSIFTVGTATVFPDMAAGDSPSPSPLKRLVVLDFELAGDLSDNTFEATHQQRIKMASAKLRDGIKRNHLYEVVDEDTVATLIENFSPYQNLHHCNGCELDMARQLNAEQILVPWVFRMSNLILTMHVEIRDTATGRIVVKKALDFRGDNDIAWTRAIEYLIRELKDREISNHGLDSTGRAERIARPNLSALSRFNSNPATPTPQKSMEYGKLTLQRNGRSDG